MPNEDIILLRKAMEITSQELQVYYTSRNKLLTFKNVKNTTDHDKCRVVSKKSAAASGSHEAVRNCSTIASKGNIEVEEVDKRLMKLEEETEAMKQTFIESIEEKKILVNEISEQLRRIHLCYCLGKQANENGSLVVNSSSKMHLDCFVHFFCFSRFRKIVEQQVFKRFSENLRSSNIAPMCWATRASINNDARPS
ncbi:hypothetical protein LWI28_008970 [Acer negundo]|uniref:Uncharacterized protein n=1 Tax=Acer negundo TaxID=4023 RepID=A0AAD5NI75_ACENE|nr:hypothetical protein LWI28_008970 [Acer negundo]